MKVQIVINVAWASVYLFQWVFLFSLFYFCALMICKYMLGKVLRPFRQPAYELCIITDLECIGLYLR